jgi:hypothetical protein
MKTTATFKKLIALGLVLGSAGAFAQVAISGSVAINKPGVYGRVDFGQAPPPPPVELVYPQPVLIAPPPVAVVQQPPLYLYVPPAHAHDWAHHCGYYHACGRQVYFVQEHYVRGRYDQWQRDHDRHHEEHWDHGHDHDHDHDHDRDDDHGRGHAYGHDR